MKYLLLATLLTPALTIAQTSVQVSVHPHLFLLQKPVSLYSTLDTLTVLPLQADSGQVVAISATSTYRWAVISNTVGFPDTSQWKLISPMHSVLTNFLVRRDDLVMAPYTQLSSSLPKRRWWQLW